MLCPQKKNWCYFIFVKRWHMLTCWSINLVKPSGKFTYHQV
jgi:hypothetical protein